MWFKFKNMRIYNFDEIVDRTITNSLYFVSCFVLFFWWIFFHFV